MRLEPSMKQAVIRRTVRKYAEQRLALAAVEMDRTGEFPLDIAGEMAALQFFGLEIPSEYGGAGLDTVSYAMVIEEISRVNGAMGLCVAVHNGVAASPVHMFGNEEQFERFLIPLASGRTIGTFCLTEPNAGSDASSLETGAVREGDEYVLNGNKVFVTNGGVSGINLIFGRVLPDHKGKNFAVFIVESHRKGLEKGPSEDLMGMRGNPVCPISLNDCRVPVENRLGGEGEGLKIALSALNGGRIGIAAQALGIAQGALDVSIRYAKERHQFGRPISGFGAIQGFLADMGTRVEAARLLVYRASDLRDKGLDHVSESAMAKLFASEAAVEVTKLGVQIHGGYGYTKAYPIERFYRDAKVCEIYEGTSEVQRMVIARGLMNR
jgi:butyryl-CoA dehydrogenase